MDPHERAEYRAFVRDNHPDRGGDPEAFVAGLARFRAGSPDLPDDDPRYDAPIEIRYPLPLPARVVVALIRTLRWHRDRRVE